MSDIYFISNSFQGFADLFYYAFSAGKAKCASHINSSTCNILSIKRKDFVQHLFYERPKFKEIVNVDEIKEGNLFLGHSIRRFKFMNASICEFGYRFQICCPMKDALLDLYEHLETPLGIANIVSNYNVMSDITGNTALPEQFRDWLSAFIKEGLSKSYVMSNTFLISAYKKWKARLKYPLFYFELFLRLPSYFILSKVPEGEVHYVDMSSDETIDRWLEKLPFDLPYNDDNMEAVLVRDGMNTAVNIVVHSERMYQDNFDLLKRNLHRYNCSLDYDDEARVYKGSIQLKDSIHWLI